MNPLRWRASALAGEVAIVAIGCSKSDPCDDPCYAAACHGPPLERNRLAHCVPVFGAGHFSVLDKAERVLAPEMVAGTMGEVEMLRTQDFRGELPGTN